MTVPNRMGLITLACRDVERMARFFRDLGWPETPDSDDNHRTRISARSPRDSAASR